MSYHSISSAVASGERLDVLRAIRVQLAAVLDDGASPRDLSSLTLRLSDVDAEIRAIELEDDPVAEAARTPARPWDPN